MRSCPKCAARYPDQVAFCSRDGAPLGEPDGVVEATVPGPGSVLGPFRLIEQLGEGGMARVFRAEHVKLGRQVALKLLRPEHASGSEAVRRFFAEARAVNQIKHQNIVDISDFVEDPNCTYAVMELLEGVTLAELQRREGPLPVARIVALMRDVARALQAAHQAGVVHRDLKPSNIFITRRDGRDFIKLLDFGVAKLSDGMPAAGGATAAGAVLGTPEYMAPEQLSGKPVDARTDIYALGVILYELVCGQNPFAAKSFGEVVVKQLTIKPPEAGRLKALPEALPVDLEALIAQCMEKHAAARPADMAEVESRLAAVAGEAAVGVVVPTAGVRRLARWVYAAAVVVVLAGIGALALLRGGSPHAQVAAPTDKPMSMVELAFLSTPPGAAVKWVEDEVLIGTTPCAQAFDTSAHEATFEFSKTGFATARQVVKLDRDAKVSVSLAPGEPAPNVRKSKKVPARKQPAQLDRRTTIDPFRSE